MWGKYAWPPALNFPFFTFYQLRSTRPSACLSHSPSWPLACLSVSVLLDLLADFLRPFHLPFNVLSFPLPFHFLISCSCSVPPFLAVLSFLFFLHVVVVVCLAFCLLAVLPSCLLLVLSFSHDAFVPFYLQILLDQNFPRFNGSIQKFKFKHKIFHLSVQFVRNETCLCLWLLEIRLSQLQFKYLITQRFRLPVQGKMFGLVLGTGKESNGSSDPDPSHWFLCCYQKHSRFASPRLGKYNRCPIAVANSCLIPNIIKRFTLSNNNSIFFYSTSTLWGQIHESWQDLLQTAAKWLRAAWRPK